VALSEQSGESDTKRGGRMDHSPEQPSASDKDERATDDPWGVLPTLRKLRGGRDAERRRIFGPRDGANESGEDGTDAGQDEDRPAAGPSG
jgi:hypothetical protein